MFILRLVKRVIRKIWREIYYTTKLYQKKKANDFFHSPKYERLNPKDKTPCRIIYGNKDKTRQLKRLFENISIKLDKNKRFQHWIDTGLYCFNTYTLNGRKANEPLSVHISCKKKCSIYTTCNFCI